MSEAAARMSHGRALEGRVVLVTGAHGGLGAATSMACAQAGATVVLSGRKLPKLNRVYDAIAAQGVEPLLYPMDLEGAAPEDHAELAARIESELGRLDALVHCAAQFDGLTPLQHADPAGIARALHVNLTAPVWLTQACLPLLSRADPASIVWPIDTAPHAAPAYWGGYGLAHAGRRAIAAQLDAELANTHVRVIVIEPGPMRTALRARAFVEGDDTLARDPAVQAGVIVEAIVHARTGSTRP